MAADLNLNTIASRDGSVTLDLTNLGLGLSGETWVDETANRAAGVTYTNNTGKPIVVHATVVNNNTTFDMVCDGAIVLEFAQADTSGLPRGWGSVIVPNGSTYSLTIAYGSILYWLELK